MFEQLDKNWHITPNISEHASKFSEVVYKIDSCYKTDIYLLSPQGRCYDNQLTVGPFADTKLTAFTLWRSTTNCNIVM